MSGNKVVLEECTGCGAAPGAHHGDYCDHAACPDCGEQLEMCEGLCTDGPHRRAIWHGIDPRDEVAQTLGWWRSHPDFEGPVEDYTRVLFAVGLGQVSWDPEAQRYVIGEIDEAALDRAVASG